MVVRPLSNQPTSNGCRNARLVRPLSNQPTSNGGRDARSCVRCVKAKRRQGFNGDGRTSRASLLGNVSP